MALLNPPDVLPEAMRFLLRVLLAESEPMDVAVLVGLVAPEGMAEAMKAIDSSDEADEGSTPKTGGALIADRSLVALASLGLAEVHGTRDARRAVATTKVTDVFASFSALTAPAFARFLRGVVFEPRHATAELWQEAGSADFAQAVALLHLAPQPLRGFAGFDREDGRRFDHYQEEVVGNPRRPLANRERWNALVRWASYLGVATPVQLGKSVGLVADASGAVGDLLPDVLTSRRPMADVVADIGARLPALDGGAVHRQVRSAIADAPPDDVVSPGLALSLLRLERRGALTLETASDAPVLSLPTGETMRPVSHVRSGPAR